MKFDAPKTVLCIHDLSCAGRAGLGAVLPALAAMGCQPVALPTAVLSTHTGGLGAPAALACGAYGSAALAHYRQIGLQFDCIYTGYLPDEGARRLACAAFDQWPGAFKLVDPVMGDGGRFYTALENSLEGMREVCRRADLILPNLTEACFLLGKPLPEGPLEAPAAEALAAELTGLCPDAVVTGLPMGKYVGVTGAGREKFLVRKLRLERNFPGTGDLFAAVLAGSLLRGNALCAAADAAAELVWQAINTTPPEADARLGAWFEPLLGRLAAPGRSRV